jgi:hypothetical protein
MRNHHPRRPHRPRLGAADEEAVCCPDYARHIRELELERATATQRAQSSPSTSSSPTSASPTASPSNTQIRCVQVLYNSSNYTPVGNLIFFF